MALPLSGIVVLELSHTVLGPSCGVALADLRADVVRIEPSPRRDATLWLDGLATGVFSCYDRNKRSICVDPKSPAVLAVVLDLVGRRDVL